jgi:hypothetical protein
MVPARVFRHKHEEIAMSMRQGLISSSGRHVALAALAGVFIAASGAPSNAAPAQTAPRAVAAKQVSSDATDFSAARRRYYRRGPSAAGLAFMGMATGLVAGAIAEQRRREYYENNYYYGPGYGYYGGGPYYGGPRYYYQPY